MMAFPSTLREDCAASLGSNGSAALEPLRGSTLVITGGSGFMGLWLASFIAHLNDAHNFGTQLVLTARHAARFASSAPFLASRPDIRFVPADIRQFIDMPKETAWIVHAAATPDSQQHATNPMETMSVIAEGTYRVLRAAEQCVNLKMLLHVSSALIYGAQPPELAALPEEYVGRVDPATVPAAYAEAKRYSETLCASARSQSRTPLVIVRPFTFLGPFQSLEAPWALNNFLYAALHRQPLKVFGDGSSARSYLYGSDMAFALLRMLTAARSGAIYNLGGPQGVTLKRLAEQVVALSEAPLEIRYNTSGKPVSASRLIPDMSRAVRDFGFAPAIALEEAIRRTLHWNRQDKQRAA